MRTGRPIPPLSVTVEQRITMENWVRRPKTAQALALRAKIILACAEGKPSGVAAHQVRVRQSASRMFFSKINTLPTDSSGSRFGAGLAAGSAERKARWFATPFL